MELQYIPYKKCPHCNADAASDTRLAEYSSGYWYERRSFVCGAGWERHSHSGALMEIRSCPKDPEVIKEQELAERAYNDITKFIDTLDYLSEGTREEYKSHLTSIYSY